VCEFLQGAQEGTRGGAALKSPELDKLSAEGKSSLQTVGPNLGQNFELADSVYQSTGAISVNVVNDTTGLQLVSSGLPAHSIVLHVCFHHRQDSMHTSC
jgi:hypothetical protein